METQTNFKLLWRDLTIIGRLIYFPYLVVLAYCFIAIKYLIEQAPSDLFITPPKASSKTEPTTKE